MPFYVLRDADDMFKMFIMTTADRRSSYAEASKDKPQTAAKSKEQRAGSIEQSA